MILLSTEMSFRRATEHCELVALLERRVTGALVFRLLTSAKVKEFWGSQYLDLRSLNVWILLVVRRSIVLSVKWYQLYDKTESPRTDIRGLLFFLLYDLRSNEPVPSQDLHPGCFDSLCCGNPSTRFARLRVVRRFFIVVSPSVNSGYLSTELSRAKSRDKRSASNHKLMQFLTRMVANFYLRISALKTVQYNYKQCFFKD